MQKRLDKGYGISKIRFIMTVNEAEVVKQLFHEILHDYNDSENTPMKKKVEKHDTSNTELLSPKERLSILCEKMFGDIQTREECAAILYDPVQPFAEDESKSS
jgi:hypothetical protein